MASSRLYWGSPTSRGAQGGGRARSRAALRARGGPDGTGTTTPRMPRLEEGAGPPALPGHGASGCRAGRRGAAAADLSRDPEVCGVRRPATSLMGSFWACLLPRVPAKASWSEAPVRWDRPGLIQGRATQCDLGTLLV